MSFIISHPRIELILRRPLRGVLDRPSHCSANFLTTDSWLLRAMMLFAVVSGIGALAGIAVLVRRRSDYTFPLAAYPVVFPFLYYVTHTSLRYWRPIDPVVLSADGHRSRSGLVYSPSTTHKSIDASEART
jgi:hypothetical protein